MTRILTVILVLAFATPALAQPNADNAAPTLRDKVTVLSDIVRIGDLVDNAGAVADVPIFRAPDLGQTGSVPAASVADAVRPHQIYTLDTRGIPEVLVTRASRTITVKEMGARLLRAISGQYGLSGAKDLAATFDNDVRPLQVEPSISAELAISRLTYDPRTRRFDVTFDVPGSAVARRLPLRFLGAINETAETVVLTRDVASGEVLRASDLTIERRAKSEQGANNFGAVEQAEGFAPRVALRAGQVVRRADLVKPELVQRNETVTITYEVPGIRLTVRGKALEPGASGDLINVLNVQSNRTIQAKVTGPGRVTVKSLNPQVAAM